MKLLTHGVVTVSLAETGQVFGSTKDLLFLLSEKSPRIRKFLHFLEIIAWLKR
jgi:hypothetical protein